MLELEESWGGGCGRRVGTWMWGDAGDLPCASSPGRMLGGWVGVKSLFSLRFQVAAVAGIYEVLNQLGFPELESLEGKPLCTLRGRWQAQGGTSRPFRGDFV